METDYCLFIYRRADLGIVPTELPLDDIGALRKVAEAAMEIPYVSRVSIRKGGNAGEDLPRWGETVMRDKKKPRGLYTGETEFRKSLMERLDDTELFGRVYRNRSDYARRLMDDDDNIIITSD